MRQERHPPDAFLVTREIAALARRQRDAISYEQLRAARLGRGAIRSWTRHHRLRPVHRGVYALGTGRLTWRGRLWAALLACGGPEHAVLSHCTAAALWDLRHAPTRIELTTRGESRSTAILVHRNGLDPHEITEQDGLPLTTPMRALLDIAATRSAYETERAVHKAAKLHLLDARAVPPGRRGARRLRKAIQTIPHDQPRITKSDLEEAFLKLIHDYDLPRPLANYPVNGVEVDFYWPEQRIIVELDSREWHLNTIAFEDDRERDFQHTLAGQTTIRLTYAALTTHRERTAKRLLALL